MPPITRSLLAAALLLAAAPAGAAPTATTPLPHAKDGVIDPDRRSVDPHMAVVRPKTPSRTPVIRPPAHAAGGTVAVDPR